MIFGNFWNRADKQIRETSSKADYTDMSEDELLNQFKSEQWNQLDEEKRVAIFQEMENRNAVAENRNPANVESLHSNRSYGSYNDTNNTLSINVAQDISSYETLDTYQHEMTHGQQSRNIDANAGYDAHTLSMIKAESTRDKDGYLIAYASDGAQLHPNGASEYDVQCNEMDSNQQAAEFLMSQKDRYQEDNAYSDYIKSRAEHFEVVNEALHDNDQGRRALQHRQAEIGYKNQALSKEEYDAVEENLNNTDFKDVSTQKNEEIAAQLRELDKELSEKQETQVSQEETSEEEIEYLGDLEQDTSELETSQEYVGDLGDIATENESSSYEGEVEVSSAYSVETDNSIDSGTGME